MKRTFWIIGGVLSILYLVISVTYKTIISSSIVHIVEISILAFVGLIAYVLHEIIWKKISLEKKWKIIHRAQTITFTIFAIDILFSRFFRSKLFNFILAINIFFMVYFIFQKSLTPAIKTKNTQTLEQQIKSDLKITSVTKTKTFPSFFERIGGFVTPIMPFFVVINKKWKRKSTPEAIIHEHIHLYYLQNGWILFYLIYVTLCMFCLTYVFPIFQTHYVPPIIILTVIAFVHFEYITFKRTNMYADKFNIKSKKWDKRLLVDYTLLYSVQIIIIFYVLKIIVWLFKLII